MRIETLFKRLAMYRCVLVECESFLRLILLVSGDHPIGPMFIHLVVSQSFFPRSSLKSLIGRSPDMVFMHYS